MNNKVVIIGLDGADWQVILPFIKQGYLPTFKYLISNGLWGDLESTIPFGTIPAWATFFTGCNPGKHGLFDFITEKQGTYELQAVTEYSKEIKQPALWQILGWHGKKVSVINVPSTYPPYEVNGQLITDFMTPPDRPFTYPPELKDAFDAYRTSYNSKSSKDAYELFDDTREIMTQRFTAASVLLKWYNPSFLMLVDNGTDRLGHEFFKYLDENNPQYDLLNWQHRLFFKYYEYLDATLKEFLNRFDQRDTTVLFISDHGQVSLHYFLNVNQFLIEHGYMRIKKNIFSQLRYLLYKCRITPSLLYRIARALKIERTVSRKRGWNQTIEALDKSKIFLSMSDIDWQKTFAFVSGVYGGIKINLQGRQPQGIVPQDMYESVINDIISDLNRWEPIKKAYRANELYHGQYVDKSCDIILEPQEHYHFFFIHSFADPRKEIPAYGVSGTHRKQGIFLAYGNQIKKKGRIKDTSILDITPTVLKLFGIKVPEYMDGKVIDYG